MIPTHLQDTSLHVEMTVRDPLSDGDQDHLTIAAPEAHPQNVRVNTLHDARPHLPNENGSIHRAAEDTIDRDHL